MNLTVFDFVPLTDQGRRFTEEFIIRLGDVDERGRLRLDGIARLLQDIATDDWVATGVESEDTWVVRRTSLRRVSAAPWPRYLDQVTLTTWCGGVGPAWAERRTSVSTGDQPLIEAVALWVPIDSMGHPVRMRENFFEVYGEAVRARKVSGRVTKVPVSEDAVLQAWPLRVADVDIVGHVNNAAVWQAFSEVVGAPLQSVSVTHYSPLDRHDAVVLASAPGLLWLTVGGDVKVSAAYELA